MNPLSIGSLPPEALLPATPRGIDEQHRLARKSPLEIAREFETILVAQVIGAMRKTVAGSGLLGGGGANKILDGAFDQELARSLAKDAHLGLAEQLAAQIERQQHASAPADGGHADGGGAASANGAADSGHTATESATAALFDDEAAEPATAVAAQLVAGPEGRVTSGFGVRRDPITGVRRFHGGIDVAAPRGSAIHAVASGEVTFSGRRGRAGNVVEVRAGDIVATYAHVQRALVRAGQKVAAGDVLATVGSTGRTTGPHVHLAVMRDGQAVDPTAVLDGMTTSAAGRVEAPSAPEEG
jgi:murein DD-endopeptidase MepM/ murein hydrolase activator NlpD